MTPRRAALTAATSQLALVVALGARTRDNEDWQRSNYAGRTVTLAGGAATAAAAVLGSAAVGGRAGAAGAAAAAAAGASGLLDDLGERAWNLRASQRGGGAAGAVAPGAADAASVPAKGLRGHLGALAGGHVTTGAVKILGIGAGAALAAGALHGGRPSWIAHGAVTGVVVAGTANLANLLDLRPGRALKACAAVAAPLALLPGARSAPAAEGARGLAATVLALAAVAAPADLGERTMLGDTGANALGATLGAAVSAATPLPLRTAVAAGVVALTLASERVSFSAVIARTPSLAALDSLGRRR